MKAYDDFTGSNQKVTKALNELAEIGKDSYREECLSGVTLWQKIGQALHYFTGSVRDIIDMTYTFLEDRNQHDICSVLDWILDHNFTCGSRDYYLIDLDHIKSLVNKKNVTILTDYDLTKMEYNKRHANVTVTVEWLD